jgi:ribonuclease-3
LLDELPEDLYRQVFTHASWTQRRSDSYTRLAFLGDSVLALAVTAHLYPRLEAERFGAGRLTKIRAQAVSGAAVVETERVLASVIEAVIGACYISYGYERTAGAVIEAFASRIDEALENPVDFKSALQEELARDNEVVRYEVVEEQGLPHARTFMVEARTRSGDTLGAGQGRSKKHAEQEAARLALQARSAARSR